VLYQINSALIINKLNVMPIYVLSDILFLFHLEHLLIKNLLKFLVCIVYAQLLEGIALENFKAKNVQKTNES